MRPHGGLIIAFAITLTVVAGCGPEKEIPTEVTLTPDRLEPEGPPPPKESEENARAYIARCLAVATEGHPERLQKAKANESRSSGVMRMAGGELTPATRTIQAAWRDRLRVTYDTSIGDIKQVTIGLRGREVWAFNTGRDGPQEFEPPNPRDYADILAVDVIGQHWLPMLVPLGEPQTVVFDLQKTSFESQEAVTVKVFVPNCPVFTLWFNEQTNLLGQITYIHNEAGSKIHKRLTVNSHKPYGGIFLPTQISFHRNGDIVERWDVNSWEFLETIDDSLFNRPGN